MKTAHLLAQYCLGKAQEAVSEPKTAMVFINIAIATINNHYDIVVRIVNNLESPLDDEVYILIQNWGSQRLSLQLQEEALGPHEE